MVLAWLVHDLVKLATTAATLLGLVAIMLLGFGHELTSMLAVLLRW